MIELNKIYNENCFETMKKMAENNIKVDGLKTNTFSKKVRTKSRNCKDDFPRKIKVQTIEIK